MRNTLHACVIVTSWALAAGLAAAQSAPGPASTPAGPLAAVYACADEADDARRLACFDAAVGGLRAAETQGTVAVLDAARVESVQREGFGFSLPSLPQLRLPGGGSAVESVTLELSSVSVAPDGRATLRMSNGQVWRQLEPERLRGARPGSAVTVSQGALGSFVATVEGQRANFRVRRVE